MSYIVRTKDSPGDVGRAADQQASVDNDAFLFAGLVGPAPAANSPGIIRQFVKKTGMTDNTTTEIATITTTDESGSNDGGVYGVEIQGIATHGIGPTLETSVIHIRAQFARAINGAGVGVSSAVVESSETAVAASTAGTKSITTVTLTLAETSEFVTSLRVLIDGSGSLVTTMNFYGMITLIYAGFTTAPVIASAG